MKTTVNKFDYPTACSHSYKIFKQSKSKQVDPELQKIKYREFDKEQRDNQRFKVQKEKQRKNQLQRKQNKKKIQQELQRKKQQLIELQKMKNMALEAQKKSHQLAQIRQQQQRIQKLQKQRKSKQNQYNAQNRFLDALRRLEEEKDMNSKKEKQAILRRKVAEETQKFERGKAIRYRQQLQQKQKAYQPQQKVTFNNYKQTLGRTAYNRTIDYTKSFLHNPNIIIPSTEQQQTAIQRAQRQNDKLRQKSQQKLAKMEENKKISLERGKKALQKMALEKQYDQYYKQQQQKQKQYNIQRIQAGKKNQYIGLKPGTLSQMQMNKRLRGQQQFQQMFFGGQNPQWFDRPANRYNMVQNRLIQTVQPTSFQTKNVIASRSIGSVGAVVSDSHYSFESQSINDLTSVKKQEQKHQEEPQQRKRVIPLPKQIIEEGSPQQQKYGTGSRQKQQLNYSQSQEDDA